MDAERALRNINRMKEMGVTPVEAQWVLGACAGTVLMTVALDRLAERRTNGEPLQTLADFEQDAEARR